MAGIGTGNGQATLTFQTRPATPNGADGFRVRARSAAGESDIVLLDGDTQQLHEFRLQGPPEGRSALEQGILQNQLKDHPTWSVAIAQDGGQAAIGIGSTHSIAQARGPNTKAVVEGHDASATATNVQPGGGAIASASEGGQASAANCSKDGHVIATGWNGRHSITTSLDLTQPSHEIAATAPADMSTEILDWPKEERVLNTGSKGVSTSVVMIHCDDGQAVRLTGQTPLGPLAQLES